LFVGALHDWLNFNVLYLINNLIVSNSLNIEFQALNNDVSFLFGLYLIVI